MSNPNILSLDIGEVRVGVAIAKSGVRVPIIMPTLLFQNKDFWEQLIKIINDQEINQIVVGLPRGMDGQETGQSEYVRDFVRKLSEHTELPIAFQDESLTSVKAVESLELSGKPYQKSDIDGMSASFILSDYLDKEKQ